MGTSFGQGGTNLNYVSLSLCFTKPWLFYIGRLFASIPDSSSRSPSSFWAKTWNDWPGGGSGHGHSAEWGSNI